ncbi:MAG: hypothetical protein ACFE8A_13280 [Candidatus Hodarchaeota archaeon]
MFIIRFRDKISKILELIDQRENDYREFTSLETKEERINRNTLLFEFGFIVFFILSVLSLTTIVLYFFILPPGPLEIGLNSPRTYLIFTYMIVIIIFFGTLIIYAIIKRIHTYQILRQRYFEKKGEKPKISLWSYVFG